MASPFPTGPKPPKLLDRVRAAVRFNHYSPRTEQAYVGWIERFIRFHGIRHPQEMGADEVRNGTKRIAAKRSFFRRGSHPIGQQSSSNSMRKGRAILPTYHGPRRNVKIFRRDPMPSIHFALRQLLTPYPLITRPRAWLGRDQSHGPFNFLNKL